MGEWDVHPPPKCVGCGKRHGSVNEQIHCLERAVRQRDEDLREARVALAAAFGRPTR